MVGSVWSPSNQVLRGHFSTRAGVSAPSPRLARPKWHPHGPSRGTDATGSPSSCLAPACLCTAWLPACLPSQDAAGWEVCPAGNLGGCPVVPTPEQEPSSCPARTPGEGRLLHWWGGGQPILNRAHRGRRVWDTCSARQADAR